MNEHFGRQTLLLTNADVNTDTYTDVVVVVVDVKAAMNYCTGEEK